MATKTPEPGTGTGDNGGNGRQPDRRSSVDRRIIEAPASSDQERRHHQRRKPDRQPDKPIKR